MGYESAGKWQDRSVVRHLTSQIIFWDCISDPTPEVTEVQPLITNNNKEM
jgi:hypothetical protein